jgi:hypothetical protein
MATNAFPYEIKAWGGNERCAETLPYRRKVMNSGSSITSQWGRRRWYWRIYAVVPVLERNSQKIGQAA